MIPTILFILHLPPPVHGAAMVGQYIHDSGLVNSRFDCHYINLTTARNLQDIGRGGVRKLWKFIGLLCQVGAAVRQMKPDLVYVTPNACGAAFFKDFIVVQMLKAMGCSVVVHYHNKGVSTKQDSKVYDWCYRRFFKGLKVILLSPALYGDVKKYVNPNDVYYCANGIAESNPGMRPERNNTVPQLLFLSNLIESKGVVVLLDALRILKEKGCSFECKFVGAESKEIDSARFGQLVEERGLQGYAKYVGKKYGEEKQRVYEETDIFVFPTFYHNECFPLVLLEAMEYAIPCISTNEGAISDIIEDGKTGFVVERKNPGLLADRIETLLNDKKLRESMGAAGKIKFEQEFTLRKFEERMGEILGKCLWGLMAVL